MTEPVVFLVDDDPGVRSSLAALLAEHGMEVQSFASAEDFLDAYRTNRPGCLVLDLKMQGMDGLSLQKQLREAGARLPVLFVTAYGTVPAAVEAMRQGAVSFIEKPYDDQELLEWIGRALVSEDERLAGARETFTVRQRLATLTPRERTVLGLLVDGHTNKTIGEKLGISPRTVEIHRARVFAKMQAANAATLTRLVLPVLGPGRDGAAAEGEGAAA